MLDRVTNFLSIIDDFIWGLPLIILILATGLFLTFRLKGLQIRRFPLAIRYMFSSDEEDGSGEVSSFAALCTALSATIGTGNIVGVATAIVSGGPGALFWMWMAAIVGTATKYAECLLAVKYRVVEKDGHIIGGPFYYIENGMGKQFRWLAKMFAVFGIMVGLFGIGTFTQINGITSAVGNFFDSENVHYVNLFGRDYSVTIVISGIILTIFVALVLIGGLKRISNVAQVVVPFMAIVYVMVVLIILVINYTKIPDALAQIVEGAFGLRAFGGGMFGAMIVAMQKGIARGIFSNEAGLGSAPIAAAAAKTKEPVEQGLISMTGTFIDTLIICSLTGLTILVTGVWNSDLNGVRLTQAAFSTAFSSFGPVLLTIFLVLFAFTTILGWNYYGERCFEFLFGVKYIRLYRIIFVAMVLLGGFIELEAVWVIADIVNALMALPNLIALLALSPVIIAETKKYFDKKG